MGSAIVAYDCYNHLIKVSNFTETSEGVMLLFVCKSFRRYPFSGPLTSSWGLSSLRGYVTIRGVSYPIPVKVRPGCQLGGGPEVEPGIGSIRGEWWLSVFPRGRCRAAGSVFVPRPLHVWALCGPTFPSGGFIPPRPSRGRWGSGSRGVHIHGYYRGGPH